MFGNSKAFGTPSTFGASSFGTTTTPFGQSTTAFGAKPATSNVFGGSTFGVSAPAAPMGGGLFGQNAPTAGTGLFGQTTTAFGAPASANTGGFGGFGGTSTSTNLFGATAPPTQAAGGLFGNTNTSAFGTPRPAFGGFGATSTPSTGLFGQSAAAGAGLFGASGGFGGSAQSGTTVKFNPPTGTDTMMKNGASTSIGTRHQCITCMKEYENKSLEELRLEDYSANRKGGSAGTGIGFGTPTQQTGLFGATPVASSSGFSFGATTQAKPLFGTTGATNTFGGGAGLFGQPAQIQNTGLFGKSVGFGTPATSAAPVFNFGASTGTSLFGQNTQQKPLFGQTTGTGLFGANTATTQATGFGANTGFGGFGTASQPSTGLFGAKPTGFGTTNTTTTSTFSFGNTNNMAGGGLFGQKPAAPAFGATTGFGTPSMGFGSFTATPAAGSNLFGQTKPATSGFGTTGNMFGGTGGLGTGFGTSSFSMGLGTNTGTGLFGATNTNKSTGFTFGNSGSTGFNFGGTNPANSSFSFGATPSLMPSSDPNNAAAVQQVQQHILAMTANPFGYSPLFKNSISETSREVEVLRPTNPSAQRALLNDNQYQVSMLPTSKIKPKPWSPALSGKLLFDGLEDEEPSLEKAAFLCKKKVKKLVLKKLTDQSSLTLTSTLSPSQTTRIDVSISYNNADKEKNNERSISSPSQSLPLTVNSVSSTPISKPSQVPSPHSVESPEISSSLPKGWSSANKEFEDSFSALFPNKQKTSQTFTVNQSDGTNEDISTSIHNVSSSSNSTSQGLDLHSASDHQAPQSWTEALQHPTGITLTRPSYYTVPSLDCMISLVDENGDIFISEFAVGRKGYGEVTFYGITNVVGLNLDKIVTFGKKEINVYPNEDEKPPVGKGLNRKAKVVLENVWPTDKTYHSPVKDPERIKKMGYSEKIERHTIHLGAKFISYNPETGIWIFEVNHFSKYGLEDSDDEMDIPSEPQKVPPVLQQSKTVGPPEHGLFKSTPSQLSQELKRQAINPLLSLDQDMEAVASPLQFNSSEFDDDDLMNELSQVPKAVMSRGIDVERMQSMKASFFDEDMEGDTWGSPIYNPKQKSSHTQQWDKSLVDFPSFLSKKQRNVDHEEFQTNFLYDSQIKLSEPDGKQSQSSVSVSASKFPNELSESSPMVPTQKLMVAPKVAPKTLNKIVLKSLQDSSIHQKQHLLNDAGYFMGRRFRSGWTANGIFACLGRDEKDTAKDFLKKIMFSDYHGFGGGCGPNFTVCLEKIPIYSACSENKMSEKMLVDALELQLKNSESTVENDAPLFIPKLGVDPIHAHANLFENQLKDSDPLDFEIEFARQCVYVWDLMVSLWGRIPGLDADQSLPTPDYTTQMARREAFSRWLIKVTEQEISKQISALSWRGDYLHKIFLYLCGRQTSEAVKLAQASQDYRLSLLLSQAEGSPTVRKLIRRQIFNWKQNGAYDFIKYDRIMLYCLLAGMLVYENVNCCRFLEWKQSLSLQLWYQCNPNASIQDAVKEYDESFLGTSQHGKYSLPPYPHYVEIADTDCENPEKESNSVYDTCYHILKLFCDRSHPFDRILMPETYTPDHLDYRLR